MGTLFFDTAQIIAHHQPAAFVLENVKNLESHDGGRTFATILNALTNELGYHVQTRVISSETWVPQRRERIFIVGFREPTTFDFASLKVPDKGTGPKLGSILQPHDEVDPKYTLTPRLWEYLQGYKEKHQAKGNGFGFSLFGPGDVSLFSADAIPLRDAFVLLPGVALKWEGVDVDLVKFAIPIDSKRAVPARKTIDPAPPRPVVSVST